MARTGKGVVLLSLQSLNPGLAQFDSFMRLKVIGVEAPLQPQTVNQRGQPDCGEPDVESELPDFSFQVGEHSTQEINIAVVRLVLYPLNIFGMPVKAPKHYPDR